MDPKPFVLDPAPDPDPSYNKLQNYGLKYGFESGSDRTGSATLPADTVKSLVPIIKQGEQVKLFSILKLYVLVP